MAHGCVRLVLFGLRSLNPQTLVALIVVTILTPSALPLVNLIPAAVTGGSQAVEAKVVVFQAVKNKDNVEQLHGTKADFGETLHGASGDFGEMLHGASGDAGETMHGARGASLLGNNVEVHGGNVDLNNNGDSVVIGELQRVQPCMDNILDSVIPSAASRVEVFAFSTGCSNTPRGRRWKRRAKERNDDDTGMSREDLGGKRLFLDADP
ncbi:hypothetical protein ACOSQ2_019648 [Xanthoceras sorbifolium]